LSLLTALLSISTIVHGSGVVAGHVSVSRLTSPGSLAKSELRVGKILVIPTVQLAWEHEFLYSTLSIAGSAPLLDNATGTFLGPYLGHDSLIINAGVSVQWTPRIWTTVGYDGQLGRDHYNSNAVTGTISFTF
jgi:hypothetical protein